MPATRNSKPSRSSSRASVSAQPTGIVALIAFALLLAGGALAASWFYSQGYLLYYGDAEAHLNTARRILDSRTPGYEQIGSPWLPLPHVLMLPFAGNDHFWKTGLAGTIPAVFCFALAGTFLFSTVRLLFASTAAAACAVLLFALNPNLLYLQSIPMTESVLLAALLGMLYFTVRFSKTHGISAVTGAAICASAATLTRYEGWFLLPFLCFYFLLAGCDRRWTAALTFGVLASIAPLYWLAHNHFIEGDVLWFYNGPYSAKAIYQRALDANMGKYPGDHEWGKAVQYYHAAVDLCAGTPLVWMGALGLIAALIKRAWWAVTLLGLIPVFYVLSMYSSGTPIYVPHLWPNSYYNTRYGIGTLPLLAVGASALVALLPDRFRSAACGIVVLIAIVPWIAYPRADNWICWKESKVNSDARRAWTSQTAAFLRANRKPGETILFSFGDMTGALREAGVPLRKGLHEGNGPHFLGATLRPDLFAWEDWAIGISADSVSQAMTSPHAQYERVQTITVKDAKPIEIYRRRHDHPFYEGARRPQ